MLGLASSHYNIYLYLCEPCDAFIGEPDLDGRINYNYKHLQSATKYFSEENILGRGGFGDVFKVLKMNFLYCIFYYVISITPKHVSCYSFKMISLRFYYLINFIY